MPPSYSITTDPGRFDYERIYDFISRKSYWARGIPMELMKRSIQNALSFGLFFEEEQVGFARVVTDYATFAWLGDVFIDVDHRGKGLGKWLMETVHLHPDLQGLRRWILATGNAHGLYEQFGYTPLAKPGIYMERYDPEIYTKINASSPDEDAG
ncbi:MAG: GNAT family N-acetyltransferase [Phaeodactylibacter sp.]|nr:GNAT family N-acetyltransferase [Phaeodactylibacter sp.]